MAPFEPRLCPDSAPETMDARRASFLAVTEDYERTRPRYPVEAIQWLAGTGPRRIVDLGCGPGKLTSQLAEQGHDAVGVDPSLKMLQGLMAKGLRAVCGTAEAIPLRDSVADLITAAQSWHWFDDARALLEMGRVLCPNGLVGLLWNLRDESTGWVRELSGIIGSDDATGAALGESDAFAGQVRVKLRDSGLFSSIEQRVFPFAQDLTESLLVGLVRSRSYVAILPDEERHEVLSAVAQLCRDHPDLAGRERFTLPYKTLAVRARVAP